MSVSKRETSMILDLDFSKITDPKSKKGLVPVVVQAVGSKDVLMVAFADEEAVKLMLEKGLGAFWSRSRQTSWVKGESSGNTMKIVKMFVDCDQDTLVIIVEPQGDGRACHVEGQDGMHRSCFFRKVNLNEVTLGEPIPLIAND